MRHHFCFALCLRHNRTLANREAIGGSRVRCLRGKRRERGISPLRAIGRAHVFSLRSVRTTACLSWLGVSQPPASFFEIEDIPNGLVQGILLHA